MRINRLVIVGVLFVAIGVMLFTSDVLDPIITPFTHLFLMGSSEGKDVLFFVLMGTLLILNPLSGKGRKDKNFYLLLAIIISLITYLIGILTEIYIRMGMGVDLFTTFVTLNPPSTTSIIHSHIFKASLSPIMASMVPSHIHTAHSLNPYLPPLILPWLLVALPLIYTLGLFSLKDRRDFHKIILIFAITTTIIGVIDGGFFSIPALAGLSGMLGMRALKVPFSPRNLINPTIIILFIIVSGILLEVFASNPGYYEVNIIGRDKIEVKNFKVLSVEDNMMRLAPDYNEISLINQLTRALNGKCDGFFITWNFFSYF